MNKASKPPERKNPASTLVSDFCPPELGEDISVVLSPPVRGNLLQQPSETNTQS